MRPLFDVNESGYSNPAIAGSGTIACGLAACASAVSNTTLVARSDASAWRAEEQAHGLCAKVDGADPKRIRVTTNHGDVAGADLIVEAIVENLDAKVDLLSSLGHVAPEADVATTTSALSIPEIGERAGIAERTFGLHPFNPVVRMELIELCVPNGVRDGVLRRARSWCEAIGKTVVEVPVQPGFVVNRLLFPYLFDAVRLLEETRMEPEEVDRSMTLGAAHPMGPLALLDLVGIDVAVAIGDAISNDSGDERDQPPERLVEMAREGKTGRKAGAGFYPYDN